MSQLTRTATTSTTGTTPQEIATAFARRIRSGEWMPGDNLPTVREVATGLGVSPATVSSAWKILGRAGLVAARGRAGTVVLARESAVMPLPAHAGDARLDLARGTPDPQLLPGIGRALSRASAIADTSSYEDLPVLPELEATLRESWPTPVESVTVVDGALDAISRALESLVGFGDRVIIENPGFPPIIRLVQVVGAQAIPVQLDEHGIVPDSLAAALAEGPVAAIIQPRAQNPTGASMTARRAADLAALIAEHAPGLVVIEDDHSGEISTSPDVSLAAHVPEQVLHVRSFSKSHGPDLRIAALGGPAALVDPIVARRMLGPGWTSRMTQRLLHDLLTDAASRSEVAAASATYAQRQDRLHSALAEHGIRLPHADGINLWLPVADESAALVNLAAAGIRVAPGTPFIVAGGDAHAVAPHVRVTVGAIQEDIEEVAAALAAAANPHPADAHSLGHRWS